MSRFLVTGVHEAGEQALHPVPPVVLVEIALVPLDKSAIRERVSHGRCLHRLLLRSAVRVRQPELEIAIAHAMAPLVHGA
ncbi:MAG: hypothetical protein IT460_15050 [Planctomycetes bacterium]|nr:hypothetical protein [Planctomycetota bacterium]